MKTKNSDKLCRLLHERLESLPTVKFPFNLEMLPYNGIYFFYERGETWGHEGEKPRIVRIGTHTGQGNFRNRIKEHFLLDERQIDFDSTKPAPKDRSVFRKNIGRAILNSQRSSYLNVWNIDFTSRENVRKHSHLRDAVSERNTEKEVTAYLRANFSLRFIVLENGRKRLELERRLIGTLSGCELCRPSGTWLGRFSPDKRIQESGLWLVQHLGSPLLDDSNIQTLEDALLETRKPLKG